MTGPVVHARSPEWMTAPPETRDAVMAWIRAHGVDPDLVRKLTIGEGETTFETYATNDDGRPYVQDARPVIRWTTVPTGPPPTCIADVVAAPEWSRR